MTPATIERALAITGRTSDDDVRWLAEQARQRPVIIELGPYQGRSTRALADASPGVVYAIDNWNAAINHWQPDRNARAACHQNLADLIAIEKVFLIEHDSQAGAPARLDGVQADMLWIDADHSYEAVRSDIRTYAPFVKPGGLVCGHDYSCWHPEVVRAVDEAYGTRVQTLSIHRSIWWVHV
jgi:predicted O-methyltransferase YrrM